MAVESRTSSIDLKGDPGPFLARIVSHLDTTYMGGLEVEILKVTEEGNNAETTGQTAQVKYLPGFYGVTPFNANTENKTFVEAIKTPETNIALMTPDLIANNPPIRVNTTVEIHPRPFE